MRGAEIVLEQAVHPAHAVPLQAVQMIGKRVEPFTVGEVFNPALEVVVAELRQRRILLKVSQEPRPLNAVEFLWKAGFLGRLVVNRNGTLDYDALRDLIERN